MGPKCLVNRFRMVNGVIKTTQRLRRLTVPANVYDGDCTYDGDYSAMPLNGTYNCVASDRLHQRLPLPHHRTTTTASPLPPPPPPPPPYHHHCTYHHHYHTTTTAPWWWWYNYKVAVLGGYWWTVVVLSPPVTCGVIPV